MISIILIPVSYLLAIFIFLARSKNGHRILEAITKSHLLLFTFIAISTEILSLFGCLNYPYVFGLWITLCLFLLFIFTFTIYNMVGIARKEFLSKEVLLRLIPVGFILTATLLTGVLYPPNNWDSMTYHMARVAHWVSNENIFFYPTSIEKQLFQMPLAEFSILHCQLLSGTDVFANAVQWVCFTASMSFIALIAKELGLSKEGQRRACIIFATIPMAILQASSTQNDLVVTSFILSFALFMLRLRNECDWRNAIFAALSLGLALLSKGTAWIYCAALIFPLALPIFNAARPHTALLIKRVILLLFVVLLALVVNSGHFFRNYQLYGTPIANGGIDYFNKDFSISAITGNTLRNVALHFGTPSKYVNEYIYRLLQPILGKQLNNPNITIITLPMIPFEIPYYSRHEDLAGNPIHILLMIFAFGTAMIWMRHQQLFCNCYAVGAFFTGLLYCALLRWQPWASRLHTPIFALWCPVIVIAVQQSFKEIRKDVLSFLVIIMILFSVPFSLNNQSRSLQSLEWRLKSRPELYFMNSPQLYASYKKVSDIVNISGLKEVGLCLGGGDWEYPIWALAAKGLIFHHVCVNNRSRHAYSSISTPTPAYVIATNNANFSQLLNEYYVGYSDDNMRLLIKNTIEGKKTW